MRFAMLIWPHANARYQEAIEPLAEKEMLLTMKKAFPEQETESFAIGFERISGARFLTFQAPEMNDQALRMLSGHSSMYLLCEFTPEGLLRPLTGPAEACLGEDLSGILKYKGKTNERFTRFMLHMARLSAECRLKEGERVRFIDPMCGKGTSLFEAVNMGWDAFGLDAENASVNEAAQFYKKYLEYHRKKHTQKQSSMTVPPGKGVPVRSIAAQGEGEVRFAVADASHTANVYGKGKAHIIAADLPYGVQHAPTAGRKISGMEALLERTLPGCVQALVPGGALALSFNTNTLPKHVVARQMEKAGLSVCEGAEYEGLAHWVEQAVTRDVCIGVKRSK